MARTVELNVNVDVNSKSVEDLKLELQALESEFESVGVGTKRFNELGNSIKGIKSQLKDVELQFEGLDKEQRATALVDTFNGLTGAIGAVSSAFIAFGAESGAIEDAEKKLLGVIGVVSGLRDVSNATIAANKLLGNSFKTAFTDATGAINGTKVALTSLGIGALVAGVTLLVTNFDALKEAIIGVGDGLDFTDTQLQELSKDAAKNIAQVEVLTATVQDQTLAEKDRQAALKQLQEDYPNYFKNLGDDINNTGLLETAKKKLIDTLIREAKIRAATSKIEEVATKFVEDRLEAQAEIDQANANILKNEQLIAKARAGFAATGLTAEQTLQGALKNREALQSRLGVVTGNLNKLNAEEAAEIKKVTDAINVETAAVEKNGGTTVKQAEVKVAAVKATKEKTVELVKDGLDLLDPLTKEAAEKQAATAQAALDERVDAELGAAEAARQVRLAQASSESAAIQIEYENKLAALKEAQIQEQIAAAGNAEALADIDAKYADLAIAADTEVQKKFEELDNKTTDIQIANADKIIAAEQAKQNAKDQFVNASRSAITALGGLFEEGSDAAKAAALADIAVGTGVGFINALDIAQKSAKAAGPGAAFAFPIFYASQIAAVLGAASRAKAILKSGSGGAGGAPPVPSTPSAGGFGTQPASLLGSFTPGGTPATGGGGVAGGGGIQEGGAQTGGQLVPVVKAYVLSGDVTDAQEAELKINQKRKF